MQKASLSQISVHAWIQENGIVNEKGEPIEFRDHLFLFDIYSDESPNLVVMKPAQVGMSTLQVIKNFWNVSRKKVDLIYTLPTYADVNVFVGGKVNRLIANNKILSELTKDKDTVEQKQVGDSMIYFRGTFNERAAIMIPADILVHDEIDSSDQKNVSFYKSRLQHSKIKEMSIFSHPSIEGFGVSYYYNMSDKKEWFIKCPHCKKEQFLKWPDNIDEKRKVFICSECGGELGKNDRRVGEWKPTSKGKWSGYHISLLMCPWVSAKEIIEKSKDEQTGMEYFHNKVLGLPYSASDSVITREDILKNVTERENLQEEPVVIGVDTGIAIRYSIGNRKGIFHYGECADYSGIEKLIKHWQRPIVIMDAGGDIVGSRALREKYPGQVFLCHFAKDRKTYQLIRWGKDDESGNVIADRNRIIQMVVDEMKDGRIPLYGTREEYSDLVKHFLNIYRVNKENKLGIREFEWKRKGRDDYVLSLCYWRIGMSRFGGAGNVVGGEQMKFEEGIRLRQSEDMHFDTSKLVMPEKSQDDWRNF